MFNTYIQPAARTEYITRQVNVTETRAPTDESVKLLREMEAAAENNRIAVLKLDNNEFKGHIEIWSTPLQHYDLCARAVFDINGKRCKAEATVGSKPDDSCKLELMQALHAEIAKVIASEILKDGLTKLKW